MAVCAERDLGGSQFATRIPPGRARVKSESGSEADDVDLARGKSTEAILMALEVGQKSITLHGNPKRARFYWLVYDHFALAGPIKSSTLAFSNNICFGKK